MLCSEYEIEKQHIPVLPTPDSQLLAPVYQGNRLIEASTFRSGIEDIFDRSLTHCAVGSFPSLPILVQSAERLAARDPPLMG